MFCFIHKWGKWEQYEVTQPARQITKTWGLCAAIEYRQRKICRKCGKVKDELINTKILDRAPVERRVRHESCGGVESRNARERG